MHETHDKGISNRIFLISAGSTYFLFFFFYARISRVQLYVDFQLKNVPFEGEIFIENQAC